MNNNIVDFSKKNNNPKVLNNLFDKMQESLLDAGISEEKYIKMASVVGPLLKDATSNRKHAEIIFNENSQFHEKVCSIFMLGFVSNQPALVIFQKILMGSFHNSLKIAVCIAILKVIDENNLPLIKELLLNAYKHNEDLKVKSYVQNCLDEIDSAKKLVPRDGIEPPTQGFSVLCSTD